MEQHQVSYYRRMFSDPKTEVLATPFSGRDGINVAILHPQSLELVQWASFATMESYGGSRQMAIDGVKSDCPVCPPVDGAESCGTSETGRCGVAFAA